MRRATDAGKSDLEGAVQGGSETGERSGLSDADLLRAIRTDLRSLYAEILKQPLPSSIRATLVRLEVADLNSPSPELQATH